MAAVLNFFFEIDFSQPAESTTHTILPVRLQLQEILLKFANICNNNRHLLLLLVLATLTKKFQLHSLEFQSMRLKQMQVVWYGMVYFFNLGT